MWEDDLKIAGKGGGGGEGDYMLYVAASIFKSGFYSYIHRTVLSDIPTERGVVRWNPTHVASRVILCLC